MAFAMLRRDGFKDRRLLRIAKLTFFETVNLKKRLVKKKLNNITIKKAHKGERSQWPIAATTGVNT
jgi:hypothetical protein